ncbi:MAG: DUF3311 domain-containing protein [Planctomycetota bacterium]|jgi:hypothetical protein
MANTRRPWLFVIVGIIALAILHQDLWLWENRTLVFGFLPIGLAYHAGFSIAAATLWLLTVKFAWPAHIEEWADETSDEGANA